MLAYVTAEAVASNATSAPCYDASENIRVFAAIATEAELRQIQGQILFTDLVIAAHDSAFQQRLERFDIVGMYIPANVFIDLVVNMLMRKRRLLRGALFRR